MQSNGPPNADALKGLPPVTPPSGKFMAQLFLVPLAIVVGIALVFFLIIWLFGGLGAPQTPAQFLDKLDKSNADVRWRAAADLAQTLQRKDELATNPGFALDLAERMKKARNASESGEKAISERLAKHPHLVERLSKLVQNETDPKRSSEDKEWKALEEDWKKIEPDLNYVLFLSACLGNFALPAGVPLLNELALREPAEVNIMVTLQRRRAVWALANLGESLKRFDRSPLERQATVLVELEDEASKTGDRAQAAQTMLDYLKKRQAGEKQALGVDLALERCARDDQDPFLRELAGFAMGFWEGTSEENDRMNRALLRLTVDEGKGDKILASLFDRTDEMNKNRDSVPFTSKPGKRIQYNAVVALAMRGTEGDYLDMLEEMLDEDEQIKIHRLKRPNDQDEPDTTTASLTVFSALKAIAGLHSKRPELVAKHPSLISAIEKLKDSKDGTIRKEATNTLDALRK